MDNLVLYRKYRPRIFGEVVGQEHVTRTLQNALALGRVAHAYLFAGPRGCGKTTVARLLAKTVNCDSHSPQPKIEVIDNEEIMTSSHPRAILCEPCNKCQSCVDFNSGRAMDLIEIDAASNRGIDEIKNLRENVRFGPSLGKYKVYLIDEAHMLTKEAFNAFLKTLEEPPAHAIFILATTEAHRLLPTIISRTQRFDFRRLSVSGLVGRLQTICRREKIEAESEAIKLIAREADGSSRDAEGLLGQIIATGENKITLANAEDILGLFSHRQIKDFVELAVSHNHSACLSWLQKSADSGYEINQFIKALNHYLRKMLMLGVSPELAAGIKAEMSEEDFNVLQNQAKKKSPLELARWLKVFTEAKQGLEHYPLPQMAVEVAIINLMSEQRPHFTEASRGKPATSDMSGENKISNKDLQVSNRKFQDLVSDKEVFDSILAKWSEVINEVRPHNHSLFGFLQGMKIKNATATSVVLSTKYGFHKERLTDAKNRKIIEDSIQKVIGKRLALICELEK